MKLNIWLFFLVVCNVFQLKNKRKENVLSIIDQMFHIPFMIMDIKKKNFHVSCSYHGHLYILAMIMIIIVNQYHSLGWMNVYLQTNDMNLRISSPLWESEKSKKLNHTRPNLVHSLCMCVKCSHIITCVGLLSRANYS